MMKNGACDRNFLFDTDICFRCKEDCAANKNFYRARQLVDHHYTVGYLIGNKTEKYPKLLTCSSQFRDSVYVIGETLERLH